MNLEAEQNIIGSLIMRNECLDDISFITPDMFEDDSYGRMFAECSRMIRQGQTVDAVSLLDAIISDSYPEEFAKRDLGDCLKATQTSITVKSYARIVHTAYRAKVLAKSINSVSGDPKRLDEEINTLFDNLESIRVVDSTGSKTLPQIVRENKDKYFKTVERPRVQMGLSELDDILGGLEGGDLIIIGARPAVGKSAFATQITSHFAELDKKVGYFNLEMQEKQVYERFVSSRSGIDITRIRRAIAYQNDEQKRFDEANAYLESKDNIVISTGSKRISEIRTDARRQNYDVIIIDYLQLVKPDKSYGANRYAEVGAISHAVKALAMEMNIPVIGLCQLNRVSESREDKEPTMGELRESGDFEQDASVILLLWNTDKNNRSKKCIKVEKQRQGKTGKVNLYFDGGKMTFKEVEDGFEPANDLIFD